MAVSQVLLYILVFPLTAVVLPAKTNISQGDGGDPTRLQTLLLARPATYRNYRHQTDVCRMKQVLRNNGVPDEHIVFMMYNDIDGDKKNLTSGTVQATVSNVCSRTPRNYEEGLVTESFPHLHQDKMLKASDEIFVVFSGHRTPGVNAFPSGGVLDGIRISGVSTEMLPGKNLTMVVVYTEASISGSISDRIASFRLNVFAVTETNDYQEVYVCYWDGDSMQFLDDDHGAFNLSQKTRLSQFKNRNRGRSFLVPEVRCSEVSNRDAAIVPLIYKLKEADDLTRRRKQQELQEALAKRSFLERKIASISNVLAKNRSDFSRWLLSSKSRRKQSDCYEKAVRYFSDKCFNLSENPYALYHLRVFANACRSNYMLEEIMQAMDIVCTHRTTKDIV